MSLVVQKFEEGGTPKKRTTKVGNTEYDLDDFISALRRNYTKWADSQNFKKDERKAADEAYRDMINEIDKGNLTMLIDGTSSHSLGRIKNVEKGFDSYGNIQRFLNEILDSRSSISSESKSSSNKYNPNSGISSWLNQRLFAGRTAFDPNFIDQDSWDGTTRGITNRTKLINPHLEELLKNLDNIYTFDNDEQKNSFKQGLTTLIQALSDGKIEDNEKLALSNLGIDPNTYFFTGETFKTSSDDEKEEEKEKSEAELAQEAYQQSIINNNIRLLNEQTDLNNLLNSYYQLPEGTRSYSFNGNYQTFDDSKLEENEKQQYGSAMNSLMNLFADYIANNDVLNIPDFGRYARSKGKGQIKLKGNKVFDVSSSDAYNKHVLDTYVQLKNIPKDSKTGHYILKYNGKGYATMYDINSGKLYEKKASELGQDYLLTLPEFSNYKVPSNKNGGVIKAQFGAVLVDKTLDQVLKEQSEARKQQKQNEIKKTAEESGRSVEQYNKGQEKLSENFSTVDALRMGAMASDLVSVIAAFAPTVGTAVSGAAGLTGAGLDMTADIFDDSVSKLQVAKNLGINLGLSAFALLPVVGSSGKVGKIARNIPKVLSVLGAAGITFDDNVQNSLKKLTSGDFKSITRDDWKNISHFAQALSGVSQMGRGAVNAYKYRGLNTKNPSGNLVVKSKEGKSYTLKEADVKKINEVGKKEGNDKANELFQSLTKSKDTLNADFKTSGILKGRRTKEVKGTPTEGSFDSDVQKVRRAMSINNEMFKARHRGLTGFFNTDHDIYFNNSGLTTLSLPNFGIFTPTWQRTLNAHKAKRTKASSSSSSSTKDNTSKNTSTSTKSKTKKGKGPNPRSVNSFKSQAQAKSKGYGRDFAIGDNRNQREINLGLEFDKQGGVLKRLQHLKNGGTIRKYDIGGVADWYFTNSTNNAVGTGEGFENLGGWTNTLKKDLAGNYIVNAGHSNAGNLVEAFNRNQAYTSNKDLVTQDLQSVYNNLAGTSGNLSAQQFVDLYNANAHKIRNFFHNGVNHSEKGDANVAAHNDLFKLMFGNRSQSTNDNIAYNLGWQENLKDRSGSTTWMRRMDQYENEFDINKPDENRIHTITYNGQTFQVYKKANGNIDIYDPKTTPNPENNPNPEQNPQTNPETDPSKLGPIDQSRKKDNNGLYSTLLKFAPLKIASDRLFGTLGTNTDIYHNMRDAMRPMLKNTYELYSPITGAFSEMYLRNREGLKTLAAARRPFTSDASLDAARMLEGQRAFTESRVQGNVVDDKEIKRTEAEARARQEDNIKRRSDLANENRASLLQNYLRLAQLKSDYKLKNWNAINTYLSGIESDARQNWEDYKNWAINTQIQQSTLDLQNKLSVLQDDLRVWRSKTGNTDITQWPGYENYIRTKRELSQQQLDAQTDIYSRMNWWPYSKSTKFTPT